MAGVIQYTRLLWTTKDHFNSGSPMYMNVNNIKEGKPTDKWSKEAQVIPQT